MCALAGAVDWETRVYLNGVSIGTHTGKKSSTLLPSLLCLERVAACYLAHGPSALTTHMCVPSPGHGARISHCAPCPQWLPPSFSHHFLLRVSTIHVCCRVSVTQVVLMVSRSISHRCSARPVTSCSCTCSTPRTPDRKSTANNGNISLQLLFCFLLLCCGGTGQACVLLASIFGVGSHAQRQRVRFDIFSCACAC